MTPTIAECRSFFIAPGTEADLLRGAIDAGADAVIADFEDMVPPEGKDEARARARDLFAGTCAALKLVRVNSPDQAAFDQDRRALDSTAIDGIVVPKATPRVIGLLGEDGPPVLALIETAEGVRLAYETACVPRVVGLAIAPGDLSRDLRMELRPDGQSLLYTRSKLVVDSAAAGIRPPVDAPSHGNADELRTAVAYAKSLGLWGKLCLSIDQVGVINEGLRTPPPQQTTT